jgi:hypothetical protein
MTSTHKMIVAAVVLLVTAPVFALSPEQCAYFAVDGRTAICHATADPSHPFTPINPAVVACIRGHANQHESDYVAVGDPTCQGGGCLAAGAPCDATLGCCDGLACIDGTCAADSCGAYLDSCSSDADCCAGLVCNTNCFQCVPFPAPAPCDTL